MKSRIRHLILLICTSVLVGCSAVPTSTVTVKVPVPVPCNIKAPEKPYMPYTDLDPSTLSEKDKKDIYAWTKLLIAEIHERIGYEGQLEAGITACNFKVPEPIEGAK